YYHDYLDFFDHELRHLEAKILKESSTSTSTTSTTVPMPSPLTASWSRSPSSTALQKAMAKMVSDYLTPLIPGLCASMGPLIHLGYGVEFGSRFATAEGLAYACVSYQPGTSCFIPNATASSWDSTSESGSGSGSTGLANKKTLHSETMQKRSPTVTILNMIRNDKRLDGMFDAGFQGKLNVVMSSRVSLLKSYLGMWTSQ
ncbi:hypothetical protein BX616_007676, partial [Lobosporangium transversale]